MKQKYNDLTHDLYVRAVRKCFEDKWSRKDTMRVINEYAGISRDEMRQATAAHDTSVKDEAAGP